jgi:uncharacterized PurR-regulated membrane protein YhhQ (DUF165 family)
MYRPALEQKTNLAIGLVASVALIATVWFANWLVEHYGVVPVGFGLMAPAGVYAAGLAFTLRDIVHRTLGVIAVMCCIVIGAILSYAVSDIQRIAIASAVAFSVSELLDLSVYTWVRERGWIKAVLVSNISGLTIDSLIFLSIAFGSLTFFWGQVVGKLWVTLATVAILFLFTKLATIYFR